MKEEQKQNYFQDNLNDSKISSPPIHSQISHKDAVSIKNCNSHWSINSKFYSPPIHSQANPKNAVSIGQFNSPPIHLQTNPKDAASIAISHPLFQIFILILKADDGFNHMIN